MSWSGVLTALDANLTTAAGVVNALDAGKEPFTVRRGEPASILSRQVAYWYEGDQESTTGGRTLGKNNVQERVTIRWYWPVLNRDSAFASYIEGQMQSANRATQAALLGDSLLGGNAIGVDIQQTTAGWQQVNEAWVRVLSIPVHIDMAWTEDIAQ